LREAGWEKNSAGKLIHRESGKPFQFTLLTNHGNDERIGIMVVAQQAWAKLGIDVTILPVEWSVFIQKHVNKLEFDAIVLGWSLGFDPDIYQIWHSSQTHPEQLNFAGYQNPLADELLVRIRQEYNPEKQIAYCHDLHRIIAEDQPYTFLVAMRGLSLLDHNLVRQVKTSEGLVYKKITPTKTGNIFFHFNQWIRTAGPVLTDV
jgi:ABC-type transport system substrate-binding protein